MVPELDLIMVGFENKRNSFVNQAKIENGKGANKKKSKETEDSKTIQNEKPDLKIGDNLTNGVKKEESKKSRIKKKLKQTPSLARPVVDHPSTQLYKSPAQSPTPLAPLLSQPHLSALLSQPRLYLSIASQTHHSQLQP